MTDNIIDFVKKKNGTYGPQGPVPPAGPTTPTLSQDDYVFYLVDKVTGEQTCIQRTGHLVVTQSNIVLFDPHQEMTFGIPNDPSLIMFERLDSVDVDLEDDLAEDFDLLDDA